MAKWQIFNTFHNAMPLEKLRQWNEFHSKWLTNIMNNWWQQIQIILCYSLIIHLFVFHLCHHLITRLSVGSKLWFFFGFEESAILFSTLNSLEKELIKWRHNLKSIFSLVQSKIHMDSVEWRKELGALPFIALYLLFYFVSTNSRWQQKSYIEKINRHLNANMSSMPFTLCFVRIRKTSPSFKQKTFVGIALCALN